MRTLTVITILQLLMGCASAKELPVNVELLEAPSPGPDHVETSAATRAIVVNFVKGLACDGDWRFSASTRDAHGVVVKLRDLNRATERVSCARMFNFRLTITVPPGNYKVTFDLPRGHGAPASQVTVAEQP